MANKIVILDRSITGHKVIHQLEFREPVWNDIMEIGDVYVWTPRGDDRMIPVPMYGNIKAYAERLIAEGEKPGDPITLSLLGASDTRKVRDVIMDFFLDVDPQVIRGSTSSSSDSSSTSESSPTPSAE
ncbi:hypothetical protein [Methylobacterium nodulans]|uniref:Uncharacterized protein n=1 Tax=Methylobacterium nodulans (strain LMG 21967 / CNCM I-2342 / ORS 2060) TaxID=460265 RepID=B8ICL1_METNO|nr:hypothetical protein [Methylobacterium nodulans]ACL57422.1 hypothetical protein Mnod_2452 [Methylobacterium nodulans ORS 2060]